MIGMVGRMEVMDMFTIFNVLAWDESTLIKVWMFKRVTKTMIDRMVQVMGTLSVSLKMKWVKFLTSWLNLTELWNTCWDKYSRLTSPDTNGQIFQKS